MQYFKFALKLGVLVLILWGIKRWFEWKSLYYPRKEIRSTPSDMGIDYSDVELVTEDDHRIHAWWIPSSAPTGTLIMCHGNAGNMGDRVELIADLSRLPANILLFDYRGYGESKGLSSEKGLYQDAAAAYEWVRTTQYSDSDNPPILIYGRSLGGAVATQLAIDKPIKGLILESTFTSVPDMAQSIYRFPILRWFVSQQYDTQSKIKEVNVPLLIAHGMQDELVPVQMGHSLYDLANSPTKQFIPLNGGHNESGWHSTPGYWETFTEFIQMALSTSTNPTN